MKKISLYILTTLIVLVTIIVWRSAKTITPGNAYETVIVGTNAEFQPFSFKENDTIVGFDIDVITEIFKRLDKKLIIKDMPFDALIPEIQLGNIHVIAAGMTPTPERAQRTLFTDPHLTSDSLAIISLKNKPINSVQELKNKTVVVNEGYTADTYISEQPNINVMRISSSAVSDGILALNSNRADAFITALHPMKPYFNMFGTDEFIITPIPNTQEASAFAISKHYPELRDYIQVTLNRMQEDGTLDVLKKKWGLA
jgi:polar amino acid transport system substrate-binding protein